MATKLSPEEQLFKVIKEGAPAKKPSPEEQLFKIIKEGTRTENAAASAASPPIAAPPANLKIKQPVPPPPILSEKMGAKPSSRGPGVAVAAAVPPLPPALPAKTGPAEKPTPSAPQSPPGFFKNAAHALTVRYSAGAQYLAVFRRIEVINRSLAIVLVLLLAAFIYATVLNRPCIEKTVRRFPRSPARSMKGNNQEAFMAPEEYVKITSQRNIFNREQRAAGQETSENKKPDIPRTRSDLQLVGIYFSEEPEVIIEDTSEKKTYFLKEGENIKEIKVKSIRQDRVILESGGLDWELM